LRKERIENSRVELSDSLKKVSASTIDRRKFLTLGALLGIGASLPLHSCLLDDRPKVSAKRDPNLLSEKEWNTLISVQEVLFPHEENAPGAVDINAAGYFQWVLADPMLDPAEIRFKKNGLTWVEEESEELYNSLFPKLSEKKKEATMESISKNSWGKSWISVMLLHIFEALLSDPIYGGNTDEKGWKWLGYTPGIPRPIKGKIYLDYTLSNGRKISPNDA